MPDNTVVRIKDISADQNNPPYYNIKIRQLIANNGDIDLPTDAGGGTVKFKLVKDLTDNVGPVYSFNTGTNIYPICVYATATGSSCNPGDGLTNGWSIQNASNDSFVLNIPAAGAGVGYYEYRLFLTKTTSSGPSQIIVDPRITNGGAGFVSREAASAGGLALVVAAVILFSIGAAVGWWIADRYRS